MTNKEIITKRFKLSNELIKQSIKEFKVIFTDIYDELVNMYLLISVDKNNLNLTVDAQTKRYVKKKIKEWEDNGASVGYFKMMLSNFKKYTYANVIEILVYGIYYEKIKEINKKCKGYFKQIAENAYEQAKEESPVKKKRYEILTWTEISAMLYLSSVNKTFLQYLELVMMKGSQETFINLLNQKQRGIELVKSELENLINKQAKRLANISETKEGKKRYSGLLENTFSSLITKAYLFLHRTNKDAKMRFIAVVDNKTTEMCRSLNGQVFFVNKENEFYRYSDEQGGIVKMKVNGLVEGVNAPPITDHFHWCRSSLFPEE